MRAPLPLLLAASLLGGACSSNPSPLDDKIGHGHAAGARDPWSAGTHDGHDDPDKADKASGLGGDFDVQKILGKIGDAVSTPGPYEAPEASKDLDEAKPHWGVLALGGAIVEREAFSLTGGKGTALRTVIDRLRELAKDEHLTGLVLRVSPLQISLPDVVELRAAMHDLRAAGKRLACHAEDASNATYLILAACDRIAIAPLGDVAITGPAAMPIHVKGLLDRLGVQADFLHVGAYKGAAEPLTRDAPSPEMMETLGAILDGHYQTMVETIAAERKLEPAQAKALIDTGLFPSEQALAAKLVDEVAAFEAFREAQVSAGAGGAWTKLELEPEHKDKLQTMLKLARFVGAMPVPRPIGPHVAVVYAVGNIVDGSGDGVLGARQEIASGTMVAALRALAADDAVKAVVLRIDSGGGSAQASELIWRAVGELKAKKPVIVSMSDVAASGGYYIASGATKIYALADTLTGSIGVVGGRIAPAAALAKIGVTTFPIGRGKHATTMASMSPWNDEERATIQASMEAVYKVFVSRVAAGRSKKPEEIQPIAQGHVWTGAKAKTLGLVDELGGLDAALAEARALGKVAAETDLEIYPPQPTLHDVIVGWGGQVQASLGMSSGVTELLVGIDPQLAATTLDLLHLALSFRATTIQAVTAVPVIR
jgi:protease-4